VEWLTSWWTSFETTNLLRLLFASFLSGLIGIEREVHGRAAGFRTHLLVGVATCLVMIVSEYFFKSYGSLSSSTTVRIDPARIAASVMTGIGFLGAGVIVKSGGVVRGLTTAACLWMVAGVGMAVGAGLYVPAVIVTIIALFNLLLLKQIERLFRKDQFYTLVIHATDFRVNLNKINAIIQGYKMRIVERKIETDTVTGKSCYEYIISTNKPLDHESLIGAFLMLPDIEKVNIF
jgi:putative Mg2+ transporter-C (MgtC) family protein